MRMEREWTTDQTKAIEYTDRNILVSAAAGSGKTAVLVERIISMITNPDKDIDIDRLVVVTFTNAAAAQMREKIRKALDKKLESITGTNDLIEAKLIRQMTLLNNAQITTIDSFCLWIIRNHFSKINLDPGFKIADSGELKLIESEAIEEVLEEMYQSLDEDFFQVVDAYGTGRDDRNLVEIINKIYRFARSNPWEDEWFDNCLSIYEDDSVTNPAIQEVFMDSLCSLADYRQVYERLIDTCNMPDGPVQYLDTITEEYNGIIKVLKSQDYNELSERIDALSFNRLSSKKVEGVDEEKKTYVKAQRDMYKKFISDIRKNVFFSDTKEMFDDIRKCRERILTLIKLTKLYSQRVMEKKKDKGIIDFNDLEHMALNILIEKDGDKCIYTDVADELAKRYSEVLIDEYQDSNMLQEVILTAVSKQRFDSSPNNVYMVGDVKQSIYKFRLACPDLFISKYDEYTKDLSDKTKIELQKNFRSRENILECTNDVFCRVMNKDYSGIEYGREQRLNAGFEYPSCDKKNFADEALKATDIYVIDSKDDSDNTVREIEADKIAEIISRLFEEKYQVFDPDENKYRDLMYKDIVVLTRSVEGWADVFVDAMMDKGIPSSCDISEGYFNVREIREILSFLTVIDNPVQEIPLSASLLGFFGGFDTVALVKLKVYGKKLVAKSGKHGNLYTYLEALSQALPKDLEDDAEVIKLSALCKKFINRLNKYREKAAYTTVYDLSWELIYDSGFYDYAGTMPAGSKRQENLDIFLEKADAYGSTSYSGLFNFLRYIEKLQRFNEDFAEAGKTRDNADIVKVMSIHKSKGLEYPVVIVAGMHKGINFRDSGGTVIVEQNLGIGTDYIDTKKRVKRTTFLKGAISRRIKKDTISEEQRLLYVAMTRAREKLIMTGVLKDSEKKLEEYKITMNGLSEGRTLNFAESENLKNYFDMVMPVALLPEEELIGKFNVIISKSAADNEDVVSEAGIKACKEKEQPAQEGPVNTDDRLGFESLSKLPPYKQEKNAYKKAKITVSELKAMKYMDESENIYEKETILTDIVPRFIRGEEQKLMANERGTAYHRVMECIDYNSIDSLEQVEAELLRLKEKRLVSDMQYECIDARDINTFIESPIGKRVKKAFRDKKLYREQPFVFEYDEQLVQGVVDLYFEEDDEIVIVDYKTDRVKKKDGEKVLADRYRIQLNYYAEAISQLTGKNVKEKIIYSFTLGKEIDSI